MNARGRLDCRQVREGAVARRENRSTLSRAEVKKVQTGNSSGLSEFPDGPAASALPSLSSLSPLIWSMHSLRLCTQRTLRSTVLLRTHLFSSRSLSMSTGAQPVSFPVSPPFEHNQPLGPGRFISTAGMIVIGDEVLGGKTVDTNSGACSHPVSASSLALTDTSAPIPSSFSSFPTTDLQSLLREALLRPRHRSQADRGHSRRRGRDRRGSPADDQEV